MRRPDLLRVALVFDDDAANAADALLALLARAPSQDPEQAPTDDEPRGAEQDAAA